MSAPSVLQANDQLGPYRIVREIARGGMAVVYLAHQPSLDRQVAIKVIAPQFQHEEQFAERFRREARAIARLSHPNILTIHDYGEASGLLYIVMEYIPGGTLRERMRGPLPPEYVGFVLDQICAALDYAHDLDIVHRDVKPGNILFKTERWLVLTDFGVAKMLAGEDGKALTGTGSGVGTPDYIAPEQIEGGAIDRRADVYAMGVILFEMLAGRIPFNANTPAHMYIQHLTQPPPSLTTLVPRLSPAIDAVVQQALAKRPEDRFQRAGELAAAFRRAVAISQTGPVVYEPGSRPGVPPPSPSSPSVSRPVSSPPSSPGTPAPPAVPAPATARPRTGLPGWLWAVGGVAVLLVLALVAALVLVRPGGGTGPPAGPGGATAGAGTLTPTTGGIVLVPGGEFILGDDGTADAKPRQTLRLETFQIDKLEVTKAQFKAFAQATNRTSVSQAALNFPANEGQLPAVWVSWDDAVAYCKWSGGRLPTEAEWEKAARGTDGRTYPWGNEFDAAKLNTKEGGAGRTKPVGSYPAGASPYGALDMAGNAAEWTLSLQRPYPYKADDGRNDPEATGPRVIRGGSWENAADAARTYARSAFPSDFVHPTVGFRCVH